MLERNKGLVRCVIEQAINKGNLAIADELIVDVLCLRNRSHHRRSVDE